LKQLSAPQPHAIQLRASRSERLSAAAVYKFMLSYFSAKIVRFAGQKSESLMDSFSIAKNLAKTNWNYLRINLLLLFELVLLTPLQRLKNALLNPIALKSPS
jgi:hypothetical protein